ncbi:hypothetical protein G4V39_08775 [Thermosulfuriphilus ammonigenes]|uniref:Uncharacterized protein n=1 Tax=Thermosulfuriphilus ammonigenes TaxID=1936021 RepID=A0A6G7PXL8_9BACT|nr:hypothetical protein [Thermosulfuriphilus ammonigenes]MBA2849533.1 hypothetical protein [Thermosulfuriphilus ammonigenes]QIJ72360.1 hypothetical protein G4V39_08775 [Thermosulfuriphilus ammonigenes]
MRILFIMLHPGYVRNYESAIRLLAERGHKIHVCFSQPKKQAEDRLIERLAAENKNITYDKKKIPKRNLLWRYLAQAIRGGRDYVRYFHPRYENATKLKERVAIRFGVVLRPIASTILSFLASLKAVRLIDKLLVMLETALPSCKRIDDFLRSKNPDILLVTPIVNIASDQVDYVKSAKSLGIRCVVCVASWDNLTNKGLIRVEPDAVIVWNEIQKQEAVELHNIPESKVVVTGAQCYDKWFDMKASTTREEFCRKVGLISEHSYILYVCSSPFIAPNEVKFVETWIKNIRSSKDPNISNIGILVRPHPQNAKQWEGVDFSHYGNVTIYPQGGANPVDEESKRDFYESIFHSKAVVGINTSAMIEAGILNKPVFTILNPEFEGTQQGTLHFHYLVKGGLLHISRSFDEHIQQLESVISGDGSYINRIRKFIEIFVRPHGLDKPSTPIFANAIEEIMNSPAPLPLKTPLWCYLMRPILLGLAILVLLFKKDFKKNLKRSLTNKKRVIKDALFKKPLPRVIRFFRPIFLPIFKSFIKRPFVREYIIPRIIEEYASSSANKRFIYTNSILKKIRRISKSPKPIIVGPWLSEVGFEILYWIPFLNWAFERFNLEKDRIIVISRGGVEAWYNGIYKHYIDIFDFFGEEDFKNKNQRRIEITGAQKHNIISDFDYEILEIVKSKLNITEFDWFHPSLMYQMFQSYWRRKAPISLIESYTNYKKFNRNVIKNNDIDLPNKYIAVKFYFSSCFPDTKENRMMISQLLNFFSTYIDIVLLATNIDIDDHVDFSLNANGRIHLIKDKMTLRNNLEIQTKVIANSLAFFGTYGGFSYLAPFYGVPSVAFYSNEENFLPVHLDVAYRAFRYLKFGSFDKVRKNNFFYHTHDRKEKYEFLPINIKTLDLLKIFKNKVR